MSARLSVPRKLGIVALCTACLAGACLLALWQLHRYESASGTLQNLGYVLQWPLFGVFPAFLFWRLFRTARGQRSGQDDTRHATGPEPDRPMATVTRHAEHHAVRTEREPAAVAPPRPQRSRLAYVPVTVQPEADDDEELATYNQYLAELNKRNETREHRVG